MKALYIILALAFFAASCAPQPSCDSEEVKELLLSIAKRVVNKEIAEGYAGAKTFITITDHRATGVSPEIRKCDCLASSLLRVMEDAYGSELETVFDFLEKGEHESNVYYSAQYTKEGLIVAIEEFVY